MPLRLGSLLCASLALLGHAGRANAGPQISTGVRAGLAGESVGGRTWAHTNFYGALYGDVLFGRETPGDLSVGPFVSLATSAFEDFRVSGGGSLLLPLHTDFPLVVSAGPYARSGPVTWTGGVAAYAAFGLRSYNYHSIYGWSAGLFAGAEVGLTAAEEHSLVFGAQIDSAILALPLVILVNWLRDP